MSAPAFIKKEVEAMETALSIDQTFLEAAFQAVLDCESELANAKGELDRATILLGNKKNAVEKKLADAWQVLEKMMADTGEYEIYIPEHHAKVCWSTPRQSVKIVDDTAVPDEFCRIKREPDKKKIKEELETGAKHNWAALEYGEKHLMWKLVKSKGE